MTLNTSRYLKSVGLGLAVLSTTATLSHAAFISSLGDSALAGATVIDFNSEATSSFTSKTLSGVTFSTASGSLGTNSDFAGNYGMSGTHLSTGNLSTPSAFDIDFSTPVSAFGMVWGAADRPWTMSVYDTSNSLIETHSIAAQTSPYIGVIGSANSLIGHVELQTSDGSYDHVLIDDFSFVTNSVPVGGSSGLMLAGAMLLLFGAKRLQIRE